MVRKNKRNSIELKKENTQEVGVMICVNKQLTESLNDCGFILNKAKVRHYSVSAGMHESDPTVLRSLLYSFSSDLNFLKNKVLRS